MNKALFGTRAIVIIGKVVTILCPVILLLLLSYTSLMVNAAPSLSVKLQVEQPMQVNIPTIPTVPTVPTVPTAQATATPTATSTPVSTPSNPTVGYTVVFTNTTKQTIVGAKLVFTIPPYTIFNLAESTPGWVCATGITAGNVCEFSFGNIPPEQATIYVAAVKATVEATLVLNVLTDQLPPDVNSINFDVTLVDINGVVYATYHVREQIPGRPTALDPMAEPLRHPLFFPLLYR